MKFIQPVTTFYEKIINIEFYLNYDDQESVKKIKTASYGYKPKIEISGSLIPNSLFTNIELRITNAYISFDETSYRKMKIEYGYYDIKLTSIIGAITHAYLESPGPDGITVFFILIGDSINQDQVFFDRYGSDSKGRTFGNTFYHAPDTYGNIITSFLEKVSLQYNSVQKFTAVISPYLSSIYYGGTIQATGTIAQVFQKVVNEYLGLSYTISGRQISFFTKKSGSERIGYVFDKFSSSPRVNVNGHINFQSPLFPDLQPGDYVSIDPKFMKMTFGGYMTTENNTKVPTVYTVLKIDFDFSTVDDINVMIVDCLTPENQVTVQ